MSLHIHTIGPSKGARSAKKLLGRGSASGRGTTAGRGGKGQTARSGGSHGTVRRGFKFQLQSTPKLRGFNSFRNKPAEVYLSDLENKFAAGELVNIASLKEKDLINTQVKTAKVLSTGEITKKLVLEGILLTKAAAEKIKAVGGEIK
jgi:large subunit ribosomal protein L15